ncbi:phosphopantetheine-binding protein, partial [Streptomyces sp. NPDC056486]|uniref:phosphopantetheine-binding protein n=1 Tax=Streptomyces sp. NPDC056486 TaxID=3345835 RepID=UPI0036CCE2DA
LPPAMIPTYLTHLTTLPQHPNGKTNTTQLPPPEGLVERRERVAPRTADESALVELWSEVLGVRDIGVEDDFYDVGGDSLRAVQVFQLLSDAGSPVPLSVLLGNHTIEQLAARLGESADTDEPADTVPTGADEPAHAEPAPEAALAG